MPTIKELVFRQLSINPDISLKDCQKVVPGLSQPNFYKVKRQYNEGIKEYKKITKSSESRVYKQAHHSSNPSPPTDSGDPFIDDPDELLYSVAIRELNKSDPDPRWASILIQCRKEIGKHKDEVLQQLQKLPTQNLVEILKKESIKSSQPE